MYKRQVIGLDVNKVQEVFNEFSQGIIKIVNYNSPRQIVIAGDTQLVEKAMEKLKEAGAHRVIKLKTSGAFHSPLMAPAQEEFKIILDDVQFFEPRIPIAMNATGQITYSLDEIKSALYRQMLESVRWVDCVENMIKRGVKIFVELGPGRVLSNLIRQINSEVTTCNAGTKEEIRKTYEIIKQV